VQIRWSLHSGRRRRVRSGVLRDHPACTHRRKLTYPPLRSTPQGCITCAVTSCVIMTSATQLPPATRNSCISEWHVRAFKSMRPNLKKSFTPGSHGKRETDAYTARLVWQTELVVDCASKSQSSNQIITWLRSRRWRHVACVLCSSHDTFARRLSTLSC